MNNEYLIMMDVSGDLAPEIASQGEVIFIPMEYSLGDEMRVCNGPESRDTLKLFYDGQRKGDLTKTSQITPYLYEKYLKQYLEAGKNVLYISLSGGLSSTYQSAELSASNLKDKYPDAEFVPVDSFAATGGMGLLAERALRNRSAGMSIHENEADLKQVIKHLRHWFMVPDLMYLKRGGRVSAATAVVGTALHITPILQINPEGKLDTISKQRGAKAAIRYMIEKFSSEYDPSNGDPVYIVDGDTQSIADQLEAEVKKLYPDIVVRRAGLSPIIGAHTGPDMAAIIHT